MNYDRPIPLRADPDELQHAERRAWSRALAARALASTTRSADKILKASWPHDGRAGAILKAATSPTATTDEFLIADVIGAFRSLSPGSAAWKLFDHPSALRLDLRGLNTISIPHVANMPVQPIFVAEGMVAPALMWNFQKTPLGPVRKILVVSGVSEELEASSPQNASQVIGRVLADATNKSVDAIAFDANAGDAVRPAGLLHNVTPTAAAALGATLQETIAHDMANLAGAIAASGIDPSDVTYIAGAREASLMRSLVDADVLMSLGLPPKTIIAVAPAGIASGYQGPPQIESSRDSVVQFEDTNPASPGVVGPTTSAFQTFILAVKVRAEAAFCAAPGAVQFVQSVNW